jgi:hypothetical protein
MPPSAPRQLLQKRSCELVLLKLRRKRFAVNHQREKIGLRKQLAQRLHNSLATAPTHKPVMHNCYAQFTPRESVRPGERACKPVPAILQIDGPMYFIVQIFPGSAPVVRRALPDKPGHASQWIPSK